MRRTSHFRLASGEAACAGPNVSAKRSVMMRDAKEKRSERRARHDREIEASQNALRNSISETERLVGESEMMLRRHRVETDDEE